MSEAAGNLFGREAPSQVCPDGLPQPGVQEYVLTPWLTVPGPPPGCTPYRHDTVSPLPRWGPTQHRRHRPQRMAVGQSQAHGLTFFDTHVRIACLGPGNTVADQGLTCCTWS